MILYTPELFANLDCSINKYLIPQNACDEQNDEYYTKKSKSKQRKIYMNFYKKNLECKNSIIRNMEDVTKEITEYLKLKIEEYDYAFQEDED